MKKKRKTKAAASSGDGEASEKAGTKSADAGGAASSVADVLAKALPKPSEPAAAQDADGAGLSTRYSRLFGSGGGLFGGGGVHAGGIFPASASQSARTPSASSVATPRGGAGKPTPAEVIASRKRPRSSEPATSSTAGAKAEAKVEAKAKDKAADTSGEQVAKDRPEGKPNGRPAKSSGPLTPEEKKQREQRLLFVGNVPLEWDEKRLRRALREAVGDSYTGGMKPIWFRCEPLKVKWGNKKWKDGHKLKDYAEGVADAKHGYAELDSPEAVRIVSKAIHGFKADENHILRGDGVGQASTLHNFDRKRSVFVGNLPAATSEADLRKALALAGTIDAVRVVRDKEAKACKGFAFVRFEHRAGVKLAMDLKNIEVKGRPLRIMKVTDQSEEGKVKAHQEWELTPAARRILMREQKKQRSKLNKAVAKRKEAAAVSGKRKGSKPSKAKRSKDMKGGRKKKAKK